MPMTGIREFSRQLSRLLNGVIDTGRPLILTRHGRPVAALVRVGPDELEDFILSHAPEFEKSMAEAEEAIARGDTRSFEEVMATIEDDDASEAQAPQAAPEQARC